MEDITKTISVFCFMQHSLLSAYRIQERILQQPVLLVSQSGTSELYSVIANPTFALHSAVDQFVAMSCV